MKKEYYILKIYQKFNIYASLIIGVIEIVLYQSLGDEARGFSLALDRIELTLILILHVSTLLLAFPIFLRTKDKNIKFHHGKRRKLEIDQKKIHWFMMVLLLFNLLGTVKFDNATVGRTATTSLSFLFNIIQVRPIFLIYFVCARDLDKKIYWGNTALYLIFRILCGWSSDIMALIFLELFLRVKYYKIGSITKSFLKLNEVLVTVGFAIGSWLYCYAQPLKNSIRHGMVIGSLPKLTYIDGVSKLISRFTNYPVSVVAIQNHARMAELFRSQGRMLWEIEAIFSPLLPRIIMPNKEFRTFGNIVSYSYMPKFSLNSSTGYNIFIYWFNILESSLLAFFLGLFIFFFFSLVTKKILYAFDDGSGDVDVLYFMFLYGLFQEGNMSSAFGYGYIALIYTIPILIFLGIIHVKTGNSDYKEYGMYKMQSRRKKSQIRVRL